MKASIYTVLVFAVNSFFPSIKTNQSLASISGIAPGSFCLFGAFK